MATRPLRVHLVGLGGVGRAFLELLARSRGFRLVGASDQSATLYARQGLDRLRLARHKAAGGRLSDLAGARAVALPAALDAIRPDLLVEAATTTPERSAEEAERIETVLGRGGAVVLASKAAAAVRAHAWSASGDAAHLGLSAVLGGVGQRVLLERERLADAVEATLVPNASTTLVLEQLERGASLAAAIAEGKRRGLLERNPQADLSGGDAALKAAVVAGLLWGRKVRSTPPPYLEDLRTLDPALVRGRAASGQATRLVVRLRPFAAPKLAWEAIERGSALRVSSDRVAYAFRFASGEQRVLVGFGLGPQATARALYEDALRIARARRTERSAHALLPEGA